jgi:dTDP-4-dehydrorhamnose 3,5-epimerase
METASDLEFFKLRIPDVIAIKVKKKVDSRGSLTRIWDSQGELSNFKILQASIVTNSNSGILRGLHYQETPFSESKVIQCTEGKIFDVVVDLRRDSPSYGTHVSLEIGPSSVYQGVFVPTGFAHGYLTLDSKSTLVYFMDNVYSTNHKNGLIWHDRTLAINWPMQPTLVSDQDSKWPGFKK